MLAFHLDLKTIHYRRDYLAGLFPRIAAAGYTHVFVEFEDKIKLESLSPAHWCEAWTKQEFSQVLADITQAGMQAVPLIQSLGHLEFVLSHAKFHPLREINKAAYQLCPSKPASLEFVKRVVDEVVELFDSPELIHVGADEAWNLGGCPVCAKHVAQTSKSDLFLTYMSKVFDHVIARGARPIAWADMLLRHNDAVDSFRRDAIWMDWDYWSQEQANQSAQRACNWPASKFGGLEVLTPEFLQTPMGKYAYDEQGQYVPWFYTDYLLDKGFDVIIAPATRCSSDNVFAPGIKHPGNVMSGWNRMQKPSQSKGKLAGMLVTSWAVRLNHLETQWPSFYVPSVAVEQAAASGKPAGDQLWRDMAGELTQKTFGVAVPEFVEAWENIGQAVSMAESIYSTENAIPYNGHIDSIPTFFKLIEKRHGLVEERKRVETALPQFETGIAQMQAIMKKIAKPNYAARLWDFAGRAMQARAEEELIFLDAMAGKRDHDHIGQCMLRLEAQQDEYRALLLESCTPASVEREMTMVFGTPWRQLMRV